MFANKSVVITGAASGIGRALVLEFLELDANVWALDVDQAALNELRVEVEKYGHRLECAALDVSRVEDVRSVVARLIARHKKLDYWINNAGVSELCDFGELSSESFDRVLDINLHAVVNGTRIALEAMEFQGSGTIVNMASVAGHVAAPKMIAYCTSKHAVVGFTRALQMELRLNASAVHVMLVSPGFVDTKILARGADLGYPEWLSWAVAKPQTVARDIVRGIRSGKIELTPTMSGKLMLATHKWLPQATFKGSKILLSKSLKEALFK